MTHLEMIEVIKAHSEGKQIQFWDEQSNGWLDCADNKPCWDFDSFDYRVKPDSKVRPYKNRDECWADMQNHQPFGWVKYKHHGNYVYLAEITNNTDFEGFFYTYTYADGSIFGITEKI